VISSLQNFLNSFRENSTFEDRFFVGGLPPHQRSLVKYFKPAETSKTGQLCTLINNLEMDTRGGAENLLEYLRRFIKCTFIDENEHFAAFVSFAAFDV
jgi:hypothetical protein